MRNHLAILLFLVLPNLALASTGRIQVVAEGAPGEIVLDNFPTGKTAPAILDAVSVGEHEVVVVYGCMTGSLRVRVADSQLAKAALPMNNAGGVGTVRFSALPPRAEIWVDDALVPFVDGKAELSCGAHRLLVEAPGIAPWQEMVVVTSGKWTRIQAQFDSESIDRADPAVGAQERSEAEYLEEELDEDPMDAEFGDEDEFNFDASNDDMDVEFEDEFEQDDRDSDFAPRTPDELSELDGGWIARPTDRASLTKRVGISVGSAGVGAVGAVLMIGGVQENNAFIDEWKNLYRFEPTSPDAQDYWSKNIRPARTKAALGGAATVIGLGGAAATMLFLNIEPGGGMIRLAGNF
jgi:hypothetical protein